MNYRIFSNKVESGATAAADGAALIRKAIAERGRAVIIVATGASQFEMLTALIQQPDIAWDKVTAFHLDEYVGLPPDHPCSYWHYMRAHLFGQVDFPTGATALPRGDAPDPTVEAARYEAAIVAAGDIDFQLLGLGANGHIGFNEPTSSLSSLTRIKTLTRSTREANARFFDRFENVPRLAITMGIGTILRSKEVVLLAYGEGKAAAAAAMIEGPLSAACPASALQLHRKVTVVLDEAAASSLTLRDYYEAVHPAGRAAI